MNELVLSGIITIATTTIASIVSYLSAKKKYKAEVDGVDIDNMRKSLEFYQALSNDNKERLNELLTKIENLEERNAELKTINLQLQEKVTLLTNRVANLTEIVDKDLQQRGR